MVEEKPVAAFTLSLVGLVLQGLGAAFFAYGSLYWRDGSTIGYPMMGPWTLFGGPWFGGFFWSPFFALLAAVVIALGVLGVIWMNGTNVSKVRTGSVLVLVASIIAFPTMFGFMIGSLLMLIGSILGLVWQPAKSGETV
ncbi:MAG: hypothetical protein JRN06_08530 [Nitrososphaerota archaeon]|nr:hypothetical protein [Nitrososphaerota archaeon]MDG7024170.1 hypothetical protein [Nitrososphaerota archaeon]